MEFMYKSRLEAFSDGVLAIIITVMVLELRAPQGANVTALKPLVPVFLSYVLSFSYIGIYWNNHHHMFQAVDRVGGAVLWANLNLLFWLSLFPFATNWMGENHFQAFPTALYGGVLFMAAAAYWILQNAIIAQQGPASLLAKAVGRDLKGKASPIIYLVAIGCAFLHVALAQVLYTIVALMWVVPDRRIERTIGERSSARE